MPILKDNALVSNIQLAIIGMILVVGIFYTWRALSRIEDRLQELSEDLASFRGGNLGANAVCRAVMQKPIDDMEDDDAEDAAAEAFMNNVFGNIAFGASMQPPAANVIISEEPHATPSPLPPTSEAAAPLSDQVLQGEPTNANGASIDIDASTDAGGSTSGLTKSKIRKMNADALRDACRAHNLPVDGTRAQLTDRLIAFLESQSQS